jgi:hypothetical protein
MSFAYDLHTSRSHTIPQGVVSHYLLITFEVKKRGQPLDKIVCNKNQLSVKLAALTKDTKNPGN